MSVLITNRCISGGGVIMESITKSYRARITAEPGKPEVVITREFNAPESLFLNRSRIQRFIHSLLLHVDSR